MEFITVYDVESGDRPRRVEATLARHLRLQDGQALDHVRKRELDRRGGEDALPVALAGLAGNRLGMSILVAWLALSLGAGVLGGLWFYGWLS